MPKGPIPSTLIDLLERPLLGHLATVSASGYPQVNPVWFLWEADRLLMSIRPETAKYRNLRARPYLALSILDPNDSHRYLELRGHVESFERYTTLVFVNRIAHKYTGADFTGGVDGEERFKISAVVDTWTSAGS